MKKTVLLIIPLLFLFIGCEDEKEKDTTPPTVIITFSTEDPVSEVVSITCISTDNEGVEKVELWVNGVSTGVTDNTEPYSLDWNTTTYDDGSYVITVRSYDTSGNTTDSDPITLIVDNSDDIPPTVSISSPISGQVVSEFVTITVTTQDNEGISRVEFFINDSLVFIDSDSSYQYDWNTTTYEDGSYVITVRSYDTSGNTTDSDPITLTVDNSGSYPQSVNIIIIILSDEDSFTIIWNQSTDGDFSSYELEKSLESTMSDYEMVYTTENVTDTTYIDMGIYPSIYHYYRIAVIDTFGYESKGQIKSILFLQPAPVESLFTPSLQKGR